MAKLSINLLPPELEEQKKKRSHQLLVATLSIGFLVIVIAFAAVVLALRFSQSVIQGQVQKDLDSAKTQVSSPALKQKEGVVTSLKARLDSINGLLEQQTYGSYAYTLVNNLVPSDVKLSSVTLSNKGEINISVESTNIDSMGTLFNNLEDPNTNQKKISTVTVASFGRINTTNYQADIIIKLVAEPTAAK